MKTLSQSHKHKKAQAAIEFLVITGFALFFFATFLITIQASTSEKTQEKQTLLVKNLAKSIQDELTLAQEASNGYQRTFTLPEKLGSLEYTAQVIEQSVYITAQDEKYAISLPAPQIQGQLNKPGDNTIKKINSTIYLNENP